MTPRTQWTAHERQDRSQLAIWSSAFAMFCLRLGSLNALESALRVPRRLDALVGPRKPSADTIARVYGRMDPAAQRQMLCRINHRVRRNKALDNHGQFRFVAVVGDALYLEAPFVNFCLDHRKHVLTTLKSDRRLLARGPQARNRPCENAPPQPPTPENA